MQWDLGVQAGVAVLSIGGYLPDQDADRLAGAVAWACAHSNGPLVLDLTGLRGWSPQGQSALGAAARGWVAERRILVLCLPATTPLTVTDMDLAGLTQRESVPDAVAALDSLGPAPVTGSPDGPPPATPSVARGSAPGGRRLPAEADRTAAVLPGTPGVPSPARGCLGLPPGPLAPPVADGPGVHRARFAPGSPPVARDLPLPVLGARGRQP